MFERLRTPTLQCLNKRDVGIGAALPEAPIKGALRVSAFFGPCLASLVTLY